MVEQLQKHVPAKGRPPKLSVEDQVLLCLNYWREYRTLFHIATSYGVSEPTASRIVRHVEDCLIQSKLFNLPKNLPESEGIDWNVVILDATRFPSLALHFKAVLKTGSGSRVWETKGFSCGLKIYFEILILTFQN